MSTGNNTQKRACILKIDHIPFAFEVEGEFFVGKPETLYEKQGNLISKMDWEPDGFTIVDIFPNNGLFYL